MGPRERTSTWKKGDDDDDGPSSEQPPAGGRGTEDLGRQEQWEEEAELIHSRCA